MAESIINILYLLADNVGFILLSAIGLLIILGMMDIINLSHAEMIMIGAYITTICYHNGIPLFIGCILSFVGVGLFGFILEKLVINRFYNNKINCLVITWGIGLIISQGTLIIFGPYLKSIPTPFGSFSYGDLSFSVYRVFLFGIAISIIAVIWTFLYRTKIGAHARAAMQDPETAKGLGINTDWLYSLTFSFGSALAGLTGALYASTAPIVPLFGSKFMAEGFLAVVVGGGANIITGSIGSSFLLGSVSTVFSVKYGTFFARISLLMVAVGIIRFMPRGVSGFIEDIKNKKKGRRIS